MTEMGTKSAHIAGHMSSKDRSIDARHRLLEAANELFHSVGVNTVGVERVTERAGVAKATLYNVFGSRTTIGISRPAIAR
jgi:AcrR family transcriptional regulator